MDDQAALDQLRPIPSNVDYFNLDDILASNEKVPCRFEMPVYRLGFLDASSSEEHLAKGTKLELPCWLSRELCTRRRKIVSVEFPKVYSETYRQIYKADANTVDLHKMGPYFYKFGVKLLHMEHYDAGLVASSISQVRILQLVDTSRRQKIAVKYCFGAMHKGCPRKAGQHSRPPSNSLLPNLGPCLYLY